MNGLIKENEIIAPGFEYDPFYARYSSSRIMIKADKKEPYIVYLEASNEEVDSQNDKVVVDALKEEADNFLKSGVISWDHLHKLEKDPQYIIGEPLDVKFEKSDSGTKTLVKAKLYKKVPIAKSVWEMLESESTRLGSSIGGFIKKRKQLGKSISAVTKVIWDEVAVTHKPINKDTLGNVSIIPMEAFAKALMAGAGVNAAGFTGGRALIPESLMGVSDITPNGNKRLKPIMKELVWRMRKGEVRTSDDLMTFLSYQGVPALFSDVSKLIIKKFQGGKK